MKPGLRAGALREEQFTVSTELSIQVGNVAVLSTPSLVNLMELTSRQIITPFLEEGEQSVGSKIDVRHLAPAPVGAQVRIQSRVTNVSGKRVDFRLEAYDEIEKIGEATHQRYIINIYTFQERATGKLK